MILQVTSDNVEVSESMKELAESKLLKLEPFFQGLAEDSVSFRVVLNPVPVGEFETKIDADINGKKYFGHNKGFTLEHAMVGAVEDILEQLKKAQDQSQDWENQRELKRFPVDGTAPELDIEENA